MFKVITTTFTRSFNTWQEVEDFLLPCYGTINWFTWGGKGHIMFTRTSWDYYIVEWDENPGCN